MGLRLRLKASFDISGFSPPNQVILTALKKYGMILADNGSAIYISGAPDPRWDNGDLGNLKTVSASNFEVVLMDPVYTSSSVPSGPPPGDWQFHGESHLDLRWTCRDPQLGHQRRELQCDLAPGRTGARRERFCHSVSDNHLRPALGQSVWPDQRKRDRHRALRTRSGSGYVRDSSGSRSRVRHSGHRLSRTLRE